MKAIQAGSLLLTIILAVPAFAEVKMTSEELERFVKSAVQLHQNDREVSAYLKKVKLTTKLTDQQYDEIRGANPGTRILDAVRQLRESATNMPAPVSTPTQLAVNPTVVAGPPPPDSVEQAKVLA